MIWKPSPSPSGGSSGEDGYAGGFNLFHVGWGVHRSETPWTLSTRLPVRSRLLGQHYATPDDAKAAAERLLAAFVQRITKGD